MDKISEFFKELKDRFSNPLFFSFIVGWLAINWKILIGLLFYTIPQLEKDGYSSYIDLISKNSNICKTFMLPFLIALGYTFLFPIIRNWISMFNAWNQKWGTEKTLNISKQGKISVSKYIKLRETYEQRQLLIEEVLEKESTYVTLSEQLKNEKMNLQVQLNEAKDTLQQIRDNNDLNLLMDGGWLIKFRDSVDQKRVIIESGRIFANDSYEKGHQLYQIQKLSYNNFTQEIVMIFERINEHMIFTEVFTTRSGVKHLKNISNKGIIMEMRRDDLS